MRTFVFVLHDFDKLRVYQDSLNLARLILEHFKGYSIFGLRDQILRSSTSIPSNIAEGSQRNSGKEFLRFLYISKGSASELYTQLSILESDPEIDSHLTASLKLTCLQIMKQLQALINHLKKSST